MKLAIFDTETTGMDPKTDKVIEVATTLYDVEHAEPIETYAALIHHTSNAAIGVNHIPVTLLKAAVSDAAAWFRTKDLFQRADVIVAHNAEFDRSFAPADLQDIRPWVCTLEDVSWPACPRRTNLIVLAVTHGVAVVGAHRALTDVDVLVRLFQRVQEYGEDVEEMIRLAQRPKVMIEALVSFEMKHLAKDAGFWWEPAPKKRWVKKVFKDDIDTMGLAFKTKVVTA